MKFLANLLVVFSLLLGQFNLPLARPFSANINAAPAGDIVTPTTPPVETPTPIVTETTTPEPTSTEVPTEEVTPPPAEPQISLNMYSTPGFVTPGEPITINWSIQGISASGHAFYLSIVLPEGFTLTDSNLDYNEATRTLTLPVLQESGQFDLQAEQPAEDALMLASLLESNTPLAQFSLPLPTHEQFTVDETGGEVVADDGNVTITFPENVLPEETTISVGLPGGVDAPTQSLSGHPIEITAIANSDEAELHQFDQAITLEIGYGDLNIPDGMVDNLFIYWYNPETGDWEAMPSVVDPESQTIQTETTHFSTFDIDINNWQAARMPTMDAFQVSQFTGGASYSYPIELPAGPGGFKPSLSLSYSSGTVDQATLQTQGSWVGMGWSLDSGYVERNTHGTDDDTSDDSYMISVNGVSSSLDSLGMGTGYYHTMDENFWRIYRDATANTWTVWDKQGTIYNFTETTQIVYYKQENNNQVNSYYLTTRWLLTSTKNIFDQQTDYTYTKQTKLVDGKTSVTAVYPDTITYANNRYRVKFVLEGRTDYKLSDDSDAAHHEFLKSRLKEIQILQASDQPGVYNTIIRSYHLTYAANTDTDLIFSGQEFSAGGKRSTLRSIQEFGQGNTTSLPATTFTYDGLHLTHATNGYGGSVDYEYEMFYWDTVPANHMVYETAPCSTWYQFSGSANYAQCNQRNGQLVLDVAGGAAISSNWYDGIDKMVRPGGAYLIKAYTSPFADNPPSSFSVQYGLNTLNTGSSAVYSTQQFTTDGYHTAIVLLPSSASSADPIFMATGAASVSNVSYNLVTSFYRVTSKTVSDGRGNSYEYTYSYSGAAVNDDAHSVGVCPDNPPPYSTCHAYTPKYSELRGHQYVTETAPDGKVTVTKFFQDDARKGKPESVTVKDGTGKVMSMTLYTYSVNQTCDNAYYVDQNCYWVYTDTEEHRTYNNDGTTYTYTLTDNNYESTYGNLISTAESSSAGLFRTTTTDYFPNTSGNRYLVGLPARQSITDSSGNLIGESWSLYDGQSSYTTSPDKGKLTGQRTLVSCLYNDCSVPANRRYSDAVFAYDLWGNQTSNTVYTDLGTTSSMGLGTARTTTTVYESDYHTYAVSTTNPAGQTTSITYDYTKGVPLTETDPNGAQTRAEYDEFGRITSVFRPDPVSGSPVSSASLVMSYQSTNPFITSITQNVDGFSYYTISRVYDGMGRQVKTINYSGQPATVSQITNDLVTDGIYTNTNYPSITETQQSAPHLIGDTTQYTITTSNINARTSTVTAPDGTSTVTYTNGLTSTVTDPRGNVTTSVKDVWGRTLSVTPPTGPAVTYTYDEQGNMLTASRGGVTTYLTYNQAGQKTAMTDPDMGGWTYNYDALGNMTSQTDARGCTLTMTYDALSRMTGKTSSGACGTQVSATYTYDIGTNGIGRRTSTLSNGITNSWTYDKRGRVTSETVQDGNSTPYTTSYEYNLADMPTQMTYPGNGGEQVNYAYDGLKRLTSLTGSAAYVQSSNYDASSRLTDRTLGNGLTQKFNYNPWTSEGGRLDNITSGAWNGSSFTSTLQNLDYTYDASGNITRIYDTVNTETQTFTYDTLDRLTSAKASGASQGAYNETYTYDPITGNLQARGDTVATNDPGTSGLAAKWSLDETSGQRSDSQGFSHVSPSNTVEYALGRNGNAASFSSTTPGVLTHTDNSQLSTGDIDFTLVASFYPASSSGVAVLVNKGANGDPNVRDYALIQSNSTIIFTVGRGSTNASVSASFNGVNTWHTVVAWHDSVNNTLNIQIDNGTPTTASYSGGASDSTYPLSIGGHANSTYIFNGRIDEVSLYKRVLSANERTWLFNPGLGNLVSWWTMNETSGQRNDSHSNNHLSVTGTVTSATGRPTSTNAASFSSSPTGILTRADNAQISTGDIDFTLSANFYATSVSGVTVLVNKGSSTDPNQRDYALIQSNNTLLFRVGNGSTNASVTSATFTANTWHTVVAWHDSVNNTINIQIDNGTPTTASYSGGAMDTTYPLSIGGHANSTYVFNGRIDEVSLYKRVLNANERTWLYNAGAGRTYTDLSGTVPLSNATNYTYDANHAHAVSSLSNNNHYQYDANGNMTQRVIGADTYLLGYDAENRLVQVQKNSVVVASFTYDADGKRVKSVMGADTILFVGAHYQVKNGSEITQYYMAGSTRIAMRKYTIPQNMSVEYMLSDHLGSTSLTTDANGAKILELRYKAWGEVRASWTANPTTTPAYKSPAYTYTGQYSYMDDPTTSGATEGFGLMFYNARWYDPSIGRFTQADTIIPSGVQGLDHYAYTNNNPVKYTDPNGHDPSNNNCDYAGIGCKTATSTPTATPTIPGPGYTTPTKTPSCVGIPCKPSSTLPPPPTATVTTTPSGPVITTQTPPTPDLNIDIDWGGVYVDWTQVDGFDATIDAVGIVGDLGIWFAPTPFTGLFYGASEAAEGFGLGKALADAALGDPSNLIQNIAEANLETNISNFAKGERLVPYVGFVGNAVSLYYNLKPEVYLNITITYK
jgi:RHS repeat-associated protein